MKEKNHVIVGVHVRNRVRHAGEVQKALTGFGACIKTRLGLHDTGGRGVTGNGIILVEFTGSEVMLKKFLATLAAVKGVDVQCMVFGHD